MYLVSSVYCIEFMVLRIECVVCSMCAGEVLKQDITPLRVVAANTALHLKALFDFDEEAAPGAAGAGAGAAKEKEAKGAPRVARVAGDEWLFEGMPLYIQLYKIVVRLGPS